MDWAIYFKQKSIKFLQAYNISCLIFFPYFMVFQNYAAQVSSAWGAAEVIWFASALFQLKLSTK